MKNSEGQLTKNDCGRWEFLNYELTSGAVVELMIDGRWVRGRVEHWRGSYHWFSSRDGIPVVMLGGMRVRLADWR